MSIINNKSFNNTKYVCDDVNPLANGAFGFIIACSSTEPQSKIALKLPLTNFNIYDKQRFLIFNKKAILLKLRQAAVVFGLLPKQNEAVANALINQERAIYNELKNCQKSNTVSSDNIVKMLDISKDNLRVSSDINLSNFIALEYCNGGDLTNYIMNNKDYNIKPIIKQIFNGLNYMYNCKILHLDLKPENILVTHNGQNTTFKITDFGISIDNKKPETDFAMAGFIPVNKLRSGTLTYIPDDSNTTNPGSLLFTHYYRDLYAFYCIIYYLYNKKEYNTPTKPYKIPTFISKDLKQLIDTICTIYDDVRYNVSKNNLNLYAYNQHVQDFFDYSKAYKTIEENIDKLPDKISANLINFIKI